MCDTSLVYAVVSLKSALGHCTLCLAQMGGWAEILQNGVLQIDTKDDPGKVPTVHCM